MRRINRARASARRLAHHGTRKRTLWFTEQPCACTWEGRERHVACTGGPSDPSHTHHFHGDASTIIPQSRGCHTYIGSKTWAVWEAETGIDRDALAAHYATIGHDAPHPGETP